MSKLVIRSVMHYAELHGCSISIDYEPEACMGLGVYHVSYLRRLDRTDPMSKGHGLKTLELLCVLADKVNAIIELEYMATEPRLGELYSSLGFKIYCGATLISMRRLPNET